MPQSLTNVVLQIVRIKGGLERKRSFMMLEWESKVGLL